MNTASAPHVRDGLDLRRATAALVLALAPIAVAGSLAVGRAEAPGAPLASALAHGAWLLAPSVVVAWGAGRAWEWLFARARGRALLPGAGGIALVLVLALPSGVPLWQVALAASFAVVVGKEVFGGAGRNFVNPALAGLAFLSLAYPDATAASARGTPFALAARGGEAALLESGLDWWSAFRGLQPGTPAEASPLACALGAALLLHLRLISWRILAGGLVGLAAGQLLLAALAPDAALARLGWNWHLVLGSFAFGIVFFATEPASAALTDVGRWAYGILIGGLVVLIRVANPSLGDGVIFAVLLGNVAAPLIDHAVIQVHIASRARRLAAAAAPEVENGR